MASSQPKLCVIHILVIILKQTIIVDGPKTAQLTPMMTGPRFLSPDEGMISFLSIAQQNEVKPVKAVAPPSLWNCSDDGGGCQCEGRCIKGLVLSCRGSCLDMGCPNRVVGGGFLGLAMRHVDRVDAGHSSWLRRSFDGLSTSITDGWLVRR